MASIEPREELIGVGGVKVYTLVGGRGDPLVALHGAGGKRGWRRWLNSAPRFGVGPTARPLRVASGAPPGGRVEWDPLVPSAARRAAFGGAGDGARPPGGVRDDRTRSGHIKRVHHSESWGAI
jgi:hypothetical protein